ncbi:MAG: MarR family winged helix-turn-helix transcriptional regulator [Spirochaetia bacterium]|jgi:DNA-binding MarR family transcriptional regulator|nr:MarR family winged helix-turn-helix transcriptional regulator [Spirochaetia bacterium]
MLYLNFKNRGKLSYQFLRIAVKLTEFDKVTQNYGTDTKLTMAEIHMIKAIKETDDCHVTKLAALLGVTKGAVSQITKKLERKHMISKSTDPNNLSKQILRLTDIGETANDCHEALHKEFDAVFMETLANATPENIEFLKDFLHRMETEIDVYESNGHIQL